MGGDCCSSCTAPISSDEEKNRSLVKKGLSRIRAVSLVMIVTGGLSIISGIVVVSILGNDGRNPTNNGSMIWGGALMFGAGVFGFMATDTEILKRDMAKRARILTGCFYGLCCAINGTNGLCLGYAISSVFACADNKCSDHNTLMLVFFSFGILFALISLICSLLGMVSVCYYRRLFGFASNTDLQINITENKTNQVKYSTLI